MTEIKIDYKIGTATGTVIPGTNTLHSYNDEPSLTHLYPNGDIMELTWHQDGYCDREGDKPTVVCYHENGATAYMAWHKNDKLHRDGGLPAMIVFDKQGNEIGRYFYYNGTETNRIESR